MTALIPRRSPRARRLLTLLFCASALLLCAAGAQARPQSIGRAASRTAPLHAGVRAQAPAAASVAAEVRQATGLTPAQVRAVDICGAVAPGHARCQAQALALRATGALVHPHVVGRRSFTQVFPSSRSGISPSAVTNAAASTPPQAGSPAWLQQAYDLTYLSQTAGAGDTIAIVDAYDDPTAESDLATYRSRWGLPPCTTANGCFKKVNESGQASPLPAGDLSWEFEESLDLDAVSALCPNCQIVLVEAASDFGSDLDRAERTAAAVQGVKQISNSWGMDASSGGDDIYNFRGVAVIASTGDSGYVGAGMADYPAAYPDVTAAGGTMLTGASSGATPRGFAESAWSLDSSGSGAGSGCDQTQPKPAFQTDKGCPGRSFSDVSADADPSTGLAIYDSGNGGWWLGGGTSLASPLIAAFEAVTKVITTGPSWAYSNSALLNDPVSGSTGTCPPGMSYICVAGPGYDGPTGVGSISGALASGAPGIGAPSYGSASSPSYVQGVGAGTATLSGGVYPNGNDTTYYWQYGTSASYGQQSAAVDIGAGKAPVAVSTTLQGLTPGASYHYRLVAQNKAGTAYGYDYVLTAGAGTATGAPADVTPPVISGTAAQGQTLSTTSGSWNPAATSYAYQWQRSADGATWSNIAGATATTYKPAAGDVGYSVHVVVTATNASGHASASSAARGPVASGAPVDTTLPAVSGTPARGQKLSATSGTWAPAATKYSYQWQRSGSTGWVNIAAATTTTYTLASADVGQSVRVVLTASNAYGSSSATSGAVGPVTSGAPVNTALPTISGTTKVGNSLSALHGSWNPAASTYTYQWQRSTDGVTWTTIAGATSANYRLTAADSVHRVRVSVQGKNTYGTSAPAYSASLSVS